MCDFCTRLLFMFLYCFWFPGGKLCEVGPSKLFSPTVALQQTVSMWYPPGDCDLSSVVFLKGVWSYVFEGFEVERIEGR